MISTYSLEQDSSTQLYKNRNIELMITGVGPEKTTTRIQSYLGRYPDLSETVVVNVGIAGGNPDKTIIGEAYFVNAIHEEETKRSFYPDILIKHRLKEIQLTTVNKNVTKYEEKYSGLVDMEGSIIFSNMAKVIPIHRLVFIKVVSDHMNVTKCKKLNVTGLIQNKLDDILSIVYRFQNMILVDRKILDNREMDNLNRGASRLKLTHTQRLQLIERSENFKKRTGSSIFVLEPFFNLDLNSKTERNQILEKIWQALSS